MVEYFIRNLLRIGDLSMNKIRLSSKDLTTVAFLSIFLMTLFLGIAYSQNSLSFVEAATIVSGLAAFISLLIASFTIYEQNQINSENRIRSKIDLINREIYEITKSTTISFRDRNGITKTYEGELAIQRLAYAAKLDPKGFIFNFNLIITFIFHFSYFLDLLKEYDLDDKVPMINFCYLKYSSKLRSFINLLETIETEIPEPIKTHNLQLRQLRKLLNDIETYISSLR